MSAITFPAAARPHRTSRNLRGLLDYARTHAVVCVIRRRRSDGGGELTVVYSDGAIGRSRFACHIVMHHWVQARRSWRYAQMRKA